MLLPAAAGISSTRGRRAVVRQWRQIPQCRVTASRRAAAALALSRCGDSDYPRFVTKTSDGQNRRRIPIAWRFMRAPHHVLVFEDSPAGAGGNSGWMFALPSASAGGVGRGWRGWIVTDAMQACAPGGPDGAEAWIMRIPWRQQLSQQLSQHSQKIRHRWHYDLNRPSRLVIGPGVARFFGRSNGRTESLGDVNRSRTRAINFE